MKLGAFVGMVVAGLSLILAIKRDYLWMPYVLRDGWIEVGVTVLGGVLLGLLGRAHGYFPAFASGFCLVAAPLSLAAAIVCVSTGQAKYSVPLFVWPVACGFAFWIANRIPRRAIAERAYAGLSEYLRAAQSQADECEKDETL